MELRHLRYFAALAEELHFGRAAEKAFVAQPTLSQQIQKFEDELGVRLFERTKRNVELTQAGEALLPYAQRILKDASRAEKAARAAREGETGYLRIGFEGSVMRSGLSRVIKTFREGTPGVELELEELGSRAQAEALREEALDVGFVLLPIDERDLLTLEIDTAPTVAVLPENHRLAGQEHVGLLDLKNEPHIMWARDVAPGVYDDYLRACHNAGFAPEVVQEIRHMESLLGLAAAGIGISFAHSARAESGYPGVTYALITEPRLPIRMGVAWPQGDLLPIVERFLEVARRLSHPPDAENNAASPRSSDGPDSPS